MALSRHYDYSKLLLSTLCTLLLFNSVCVHGAIEDDIHTSMELQRRVRSSFYLLGYCSSYQSSECKSLVSLLESSDAQTDGSLIKTGLVVYDAAYWQPHGLATSPAVMLWFACHDGRQIRIKPIDITESDVLIDSLTAAAQQQGAGCIAGQRQHMKPGAAAAAAETDATLEAFLQGLDMSNMYNQQRRYRIEIVGFNITAVITVIGLGVFLHLIKHGSHDDCNFAAMCTAIPAAVAVKLGIDVLLQLWGFEEGTTWWLVILFWFLVFGLLAALGGSLEQSSSAAANSKSSVAGDMECTAVNKSSEAETPGLPNGARPVCGYQQVSTTEDKLPTAKPSTDMLV